MSTIQQNVRAMLKHLCKNSGLQFVSERYYRDVLVYNLMSTKMIIDYDSIGVKPILSNDNSSK